MIKTLAQWWTLIVSLLFIIAVGISMTIDTLENGITLETGHKASHVIIGMIGLSIIKNASKAYKFTIFNAALYGTFALIGWTRPDYLGLAAFNRIDTILHSIVSISALLSAQFTNRQR